MKGIVLGRDQEGKVVEVDLKVLLRTRFLVQAASGGGKSRTLRRLAEQFFGKVPVWIIDRDSEFPSLRSHFGYVYSGPGGETVTDPRSAELVCERLLKAKASAIFGLYELKEPVRHEWVQIFLNALMNAPKSLWTHVIVMVDEAHKFCPEKGQGESVAKDAMTDLAVDGRKRGFCAGYFTQRLGKLSKNASAELLNRLVGKTVEDIDVDRAVDLMSVRRGERDDFEHGIKRLTAGNFWTFGDAISIDRILVHVGDVITKHQEPGDPPPATPPPLPEKMKAILPQLADLPKEAEQKARTEAELKKEVATLKAQLASAQRIAAAAVKNVRPPAPAAPAPKPEIRIETKIVEVPAVSGDEVKRINALLVRMEKLSHRFDPVVELQSGLWSTIKDLGGQLSDAVEAAENLRKKPPPPPPPKVVVAAPRPVPPPRQIAATTPPDDGADVVLTNPRLGILRGLVELASIGIESPSRPQLAGWLGKKVSGSYKNDLGALRTAGHINYQGDQVILTDSGRATASAPELEVTNKAIFDHVLSAVSNPQKAILKTVYESHPEWVTREELAARIGIQVSGSFKNNLGALRTAQMLEYGTGDRKNYVKCADWMFVEQAVAS